MNPVEELIKLLENENCDYDRCRQLIKEIGGCTKIIKVRYEMETTALHEVISMGHYDFALELIAEPGADLDVRTEDESPIIWDLQYLWEEKLEDQWIESEKKLAIMRALIRSGANPKMPTMLEWKTMAENGSMYNTPPCYTIYMAKLVYEWILDMGGLDVMKEKNVKKAKVLYDYLDSQDYYIAPVKADSRSMMNVTFVTGDADLDKKFASEAAKAGLKNLKGHRSVGGMRASIYNAMPYEGVEALVAFMKKFAAENPKA